MTDFRFEKEGHKYTLDGDVLSHITAVIAAVQPVTFFTEESRDRGTAVHACVESIVKGDGNLEDLVHAEPDAVGYIKALERFFSEKKLKVKLCEFPLYHSRYLYAGTLDLYGTIDGRKEPDVIDVKSGVSHPSHGLQTAAQAELLFNNKYKKPRRRFSLLLQPDGQYKLVQHKEHTDFSVFLSLLNIHRWKKSHNIK